MLQLAKPCTEETLKSFIIENNSNLNYFLSETDDYYYLLKPYEHLEGNEVIVDTTEKDNYDLIEALNASINTGLENGSFALGTITLDTTESNTFEIEAGKQYNVTLTQNITLTVANVPTNKLFQQMLVQVNAPSTYNITSFGTTTYFNGKKPDLTEAGLYNLFYEWDNASQVWVCGSVKKSQVS